MDDVKVICLKDPNYNLSIKDGRAVFARASSNECQHWCKHEEYAKGKVDKYGRKAFALVNNGTGQALKHYADGKHVELVDFDPSDLDESLLWTDGSSWGKGYSPIWMINNVNMNLQAKDGVVHSGSTVQIANWNGGGPNQLWKIVPY
ncbi:carboxypeptidase Y [Tripterygium wilfordii]|uniref:Carboxypeptidase Y n=1 Tax=Tripterygium wilfordii TaxID=458696 RepID=A0A7J7DTD9_TRIWF|nr:ricin B-like lectin EULS3 [Tripterygium wilfordii]KAF5749563.1 carboxypeptidase Y [Tripterygium wilfordii]